MKGTAFFLTALVVAFLVEALLAEDSFAAVWPFEALLVEDFLVGALLVVGFSADGFELSGGNEVFEDENRR